MGSAYQFHSWRVFVLVCAFPSVAAIAALSAMPESPRFYLEVSRCVPLLSLVHVTLHSIPALADILLPNFISGTLTEISQEEKCCACTVTFTF